jgi:hypothetical protein
MYDYIGGYYIFHYDRGIRTFYIGEYDPRDGTLIVSTLDRKPINGRYDEQTKSISFNDAEEPGESLFVRFFTGYVVVAESNLIDPPANRAVYMAGTYKELELNFVLGPSGRYQGRTATIESAWYAIPVD